MKRFSIGIAIFGTLIALAGCTGGPAGNGQILSSGITLQSAERVNEILVNKQIPGLKIIDVRTPAEFHADCIAGAKNIDVESSDFDTKIAALDKNVPYLVYCRSGRRSATAVEKMKAAGFSNIIELQDGINAWKAADEPVSKQCSD